MITKKTGTKNAKKQTKVNTKSIIDFGNRKIVGQNFSKLVSLPKTALQNLGTATNLKVELVQENGEKFLKLSPVRGDRK